MTAAGIVSLIYATAALDPRPEALDRARKSGPVGLGLRAFHASRKRRLGRLGNFYALYSIDRRRALAPLFGVVGPSIVPRLIDRLESDGLQTREGAWDLLQRIVEQKFVYDPRWSESRRKLMLRALRRFWAEQGSRLAWNGAKQAFRLSDR